MMIDHYLSSEPSGSKGKLLWRPSVVNHFQRSSPKPLGQFNQTFMWGLNGKGNTKVCMAQTKMAAPPIYGKVLTKSSSLEP